MFTTFLFFRYIRVKWLRVVEACIVAAVTATAGFLMMFTINDCKPLGLDPTKYPTQVSSLIKFCLIHFVMSS